MIHETYSAEGLKLVFTALMTNGWKVRTLDVKIACLQGKEMTREVYVRPPKEALSRNCSRNLVWRERVTCIFGEGFLYLYFKKNAENGMEDRGAFSIAR